MNGRGSAFFIQNLTLVVVFLDANPWPVQSGVQWSGWGLVISSDFLFTACLSCCSGITGRGGHRWLVAARGGRTVTLHSVLLRGRFNVVSGNFILTCFWLADEERCCCLSIEVVLSV